MIDAVANAKREEVDRIESEVEERLKIQARLTQSEARQRHMANEAADKDKKIVELKNIQSKIENLLSESQTKCIGLESELAHKDNALREANRKLERNLTNYNENMRNARKYMSMKLLNLRSDINAISTSHALELEMNRKSLQGIVNEVLRYFRDKISNLKNSAVEDKQKALDELSEEFQVKLKEYELGRLEDKVKDQSSYDKIIQTHLMEKESLKREIDQYRNDILELQSKVESQNSLISSTNSKLDRSERELQSLREINQQKSDEFERLQNFVHKELRRVKEDSQNVMDETIRQIEEEHGKDLRTLF